jgi:hypothetical protein
VEFPLLTDVSFPAFRGAVAQLGERLNGIQEVVGSIPISSTNSRTSTMKTAAERPPFLFVGWAFRDQGRPLQLRPVSADQN